MSFDRAKNFLINKGFGDRVLQFESSSATVELAAKALGCDPQRIAKSLTFMQGGEPIMIICAGDVKIANAKYKERFGQKAKMLSHDEVSALIGHDVGGVCPFGVNEGVKVYLDVSLKRFDVVYPACGDSQSAVRLTPDELNGISGSVSWVDVCQIIEKVD